jgi:hypothetical protein
MKKIFFVLILLAVHVTAWAQKPAIITDDKAGWMKIGEVVASFQVEKDGISVLGADRFKAIKLRVTDAPIIIYDVEVYYESGDTEHLDVKSELKAGQETRSYDLKGSSRELKKIVFTYKSAAQMDNAKAHVELYGLK